MQADSFMEEFALAGEQQRAELLTKLVPNSNEFYHYSLIHLLNTDKRNTKEFDHLWDAYKKTKGSSTLHNYLEIAKSLKGPTPEALQFLKERFSLTYDHVKSEYLPATYPSKLDESWQEKAIEESLAKKNGYTSEFTPMADIHMLDVDDPQVQQAALSRVTEPNHDNLVPLIVEDILSNKRDFSSFSVHLSLSLSQLDLLLSLVPDLILHSRFVETYISKIQPQSFVNLDIQPEKRYELLQQIYAFTQKLSPNFNSQKVFVLYHLLKYEEKNRKYNNELFLEYLTALKGVRAAPPICIPQRDQFGYLHDPSFNAVVLPFASAEDHENLTKRFLLHFFANPQVNDFKEYQTLLVDTYLRDIYIEAKLLSGSDKIIHDSADSVRVAGQIKDRVDIDFLPANKSLFKPEDDVVLLCDIKNVSTLYVKMFEINTVNFYETNYYEIPVDIDLDGLVPTEEQVLKYDDAPIKKITRELQFPSLKNRRGVFVIEVVGNGKSSRALIKKGYLNYHKETGVAGHAYTVLDENNGPVTGAAIWMDGHWFTSNDYNQIIVPHGASPSHIIITKDNFATMHRPFHQNENYHLSSYTHIDGESIVRGKNATILIKPILNVSGAAPVSVEMIENVTLVVEFEDGDNIETTKVIDQFELYDERPSTYEFLVTENLRKLVVTLKGRVKTYDGDYVDVSTSSSLEVNAQDSTSNTESAYLRYSKDGYKIVVLGKNGEHKANRVLTIRLWHYYLVNYLEYTLQTDASGTVFLGKLHNVTKVTVEQPHQIWDLSIFNQFSYCRTLTAGANELITIPYLGSFDSVKREEFSLLETRSGYYTHDHFDSLHLKDGSIQVQLPQGIYNFRIASQQLDIQLQVLPAKPNEEHGYITPVGGDTYEYSAVHVRPPFASTATTTEKDIVIKIENARKTTKVAVTAKYFVPLEEPDVPKANETDSFSHEIPLSVYVNSRRLGDEYMYIIDRKHAKKYPGNHLKRPSPLLAPWEVQSTKTSRQDAESGEPMPCAPAPAAACDFMELGGMAKNRMVNSRTRAPLKPTYDFLSSPAATVANLQPDKDGLVKIDRNLVRGSLVTVIVLDEVHTNVRQFGLEDCNLESRETTLQGGLDPSKHFAEIKLVETLQPNSSLVIKNAGSAAFAIYDTVGKLYSLYKNLVKFQELEEFDFVIRWPSLSDSQKKEKYGKMVSHELNFFLYKKDPAFFEAVVKPFISCKKEKTFMDYYLLDAKEELKQYLTVSRFHQLNNITEKILLGQKFPTESAAIHKLVASLYENKSSDRVEFNKVFSTAIKGNAASAPMAQSYAASTSRERGVAMNFAAAPMTMSRMAAPISRAKVFYEPPAKTKEYAETNYYKVKSSNKSELVPVNAFWKDYAVHIANSPDAKFLPKNVSIPATYTDALFSLAVVDLPFNLENAHAMNADGDSLNIVTATPAVIFHKEVVPAELEQSTIFVSENFFDPENEFKTENGERIQVYVTEEFLVGKVYGSTVTLTNGSSSSQRIETLYQVPEGSIPVNNGSFTKGKFETIRPYSIITFNYFFYFPRSGSFKHFPVHATKDKKVIAAAQPTTLKVVEQFSKKDFTSWELIAESGSNEQALNFLSTQNITNVNLASIAWRMRDKDFLIAVTDLLRKLYVYDESIWSYGLYHDIPKLVSEYVSRQISFIESCKPVLNSPLLKVDPEEYNFIYEHLDYFPLINARAHQLGKSRQILNDRFKQQYEKLLNILALKNTHTENDKLAVTSYLLLQDRVEEAINYFQTIAPTGDDKHVSPVQLQYDYMACYLDLFNDTPTKAPVIAAKYTNYPVPRWNSLFKDIRNKLASITDASIVVQDSTDEERDRDRQQASMAKTEPHFTFSVESKQISIDYENIDKCTINYYVMDIEVTFSINPFDSQDLGRFSYVTPNKHEEVNLPADRKSVTVNLPAEYHNSNIMIDIKAQGIRKSKPYYSHSLNVHVIQNYGQVKVLHSTTRKPISKAYVKVYSRQHSNAVTFYKDGYTDLAGTFDYTSLSTDDLDQASRFAILVVSDQHGAVIVEAAPPAYAH